MMYVGNAEKYAEQVRKVLAGELIVYEGEHDENVELAGSRVFDTAVDICGRWIRELLLAELELHPEYRSVQCSIKFPCNYLDVSIGVEASEESAGGRSLPERTETPIGVMDQFVFRALKMYDNPVAVLYKHMELLARHIHHLLAMRGSDTTFISREVLTENQINDSVCIHFMDSILCNLGDFFEMNV